MIFSILDQVRNWLCVRYNHRWTYKDYSNYMKSDGSRYDFVASRRCIRCNQHAYYTTMWKNAEKSRFDYEAEYFSIDSIMLDKVTYS